MIISISKEVTFLTLPAKFINYCNYLMLVTIQYVEMSSSRHRCVHAVRFVFLIRRLFQLLFV